MTRTIIHWATIVGLGVLTAACDSSNSGGGGASACSNVAPCGGTLDGTWQLDSVCVEGNVAAAMNTSMGLPTECSSLFQSATMTGSGTVTFANGTETDNITENTAATAVFTPACASAVASAQLGTTVNLTLDAGTCTEIGNGMVGQSGISSATCTFSGGNCKCDVAIVTVDTGTKTYSISGDTVTYTDGTDPIDYCVNGTALTARQVQSGLDGITMISALHKSG